jgi:hypothetical protein
MTKDPNQQHIWTTGEEIKFINRLIPGTRKQYLEGLNHRNNWGKIDRTKVMNMFLK